MEAHETKEINKAGQLAFSTDFKTGKQIKQTDVVFIHVKEDRYHPYKIVQTSMPTANSIQFTCIEYAYYLFNKDGLVHDKRPNNLSVGDVIAEVIKGTKWQVGYVDSSLPKFTGSFYWVTRTECFSKLVEQTGVELEFYMTMSDNQINGRYIDAYKQVGTDTHQRFTYGMNALEVVAESSSVDTVTKVYPRGSGEMYTSEGDGERKLTIESVEWSKAKGDPTDKPLGQDYLVYGSAEYDLDNENQPSAIVEFQDEKDANALIKKAFNWLKQNNRPQVQFKAKVSEVGDLKLGDRVVIDREDMNIKYVTRVFKIDRNLLNEKLNTIELGDIVSTSLADTLNKTINESIVKNNTSIKKEFHTIVNANGQTITYGPDEPQTKKKGDTWFKPADIVEGVQQYDVYVWDGEKWVLTIGNQLQNELIAKVDQAQKDTEAAKQQAQEASNKADAIENKFENDLNNVRIDIDGVKYDTVNALQKAEDAVLNANAAQQGVDTLKDRVAIYSTNVENLFPNGNFSDTAMKEFNLISGRYTTQGVTNSPQGSFSQLGVAYPTKNANRNACTINNGKDVLEVKPEYSFNVNSGEEFYIQYDFYNDTPMLVEVGIIFNSGQKVAVRQNTAGLRSWHRIKGKVKAPDGATSGCGYISMSDNVSAYCFVSNVSISRVDASTSLIELQDGKITEAVKQGEALNQRVQTAEGTIESIENMEGDNTLVNTVKGQQQSIKDAQGNALEALETAKGAQTVVYNTGNIWMTPDFQDTPLSKYTYTADNDANVHIVTNGARDTATDPIKYNEPYRRKNPSTKSIRFEGRLDGNRDCFQKDAYNIQVSAGDVFDVGFDFYKTSEAAAGCGFKLIADDGSISWIALYAYPESGGNWWHMDGQLTVPGDKNYVKAQAFISYGRVKSAGQYCYMDNVSIRRATGSTVGQFSKLTQTADLIKGEVSSLDEKTKTSLALLQDNINLKVDKDGVINQINVSPEGVLIDGDKIHLTGQTTIDNAIIPSAAIKDLSADKITTGTLNAANVNITNLDVNTLTGDYSQFLKTAWKDNNSYSEITPDGLKFYKEKDNIFSKDTYLSIYSNQLTWRTSNKAWHYINQSNNIIRNNLTIGAVTNNAEVPASINIRSSGYDTMTSVSQNGMYSGKYTFVGADYGMTISEGMKTAQSDLRAAEQPEDLGPGLVLDRHTYVTRVAAENNILMNVINEAVGQGFRFDTTSFDDETSVNHNFNIIYQDDNWSGLFIKSIPTYKRTYSYSSNMFVTSNGYIGRATSAKKYKQDIEYIDNIEEAKRTLDIQPAEWSDKKVMEHRAKVRSTKNDTKLSESLRRRYIGFIADDFADAGFEKLVLRDDKGEVEEFQYDRLSVYHHQMIKDLYSQIDELKAEIEELKRGSEK